MANESFKREYKLYQQSPMIHFQYSEKGATLRATEVKPKLDRYIIKQNGGIEECRKKHKEWFIDEKSDALNYKIRIEARGNPIVSKTVEKDLELSNTYDKEEKKRIRNKYREYDIHGSYFGNMVKKGENVEEKYKETVFYKEPIIITIICFVPGLCNEINESISDFFIVTNFGTRQNKGFGSFVVYDDNGNPPSEQTVSTALKSFYGAKTCYAFLGGDMNTALDRINTIYSIMKSGLNNSYINFYRRSLLFVYMHKKGIGNEKAYLKQKKLAPATGHRPYHRDNEDHKSHYVRALLGIGYALRFPKEKVTITIDDKEKNKEKSKTIERLASPIFFTIIGRTVYFVAGRINPSVFGREFKFSTGGKFEYLSVPNADEIDENFLDGFLEYCRDELNNTKPNEGNALSDHLDFKDFKGKAIVREVQ